MKDLTPYVRSESYIDGLKKGQNDAWEFVVKCLKMDGSDFYEIFDSCDVMCLTNLSYQEAKSQYEAWKNQKDRIRVGDEVEYKCAGEVVKFIVTGVVGSIVYGFKSPCGYDDVGDYCLIEDLRKTGRHFPEVAELLKKMRGSDED